MLIITHPMRPDPAPPIYQGVEVGTADDTTSVTVNVPAATVDGDRLLLALTKTTAASLSGLSGWDVVLASEDGAVPLYVYERTADSEPADYTVTWSGNDDAVAVISLATQCGPVTFHGSNTPSSASPVESYQGATGNYVTMYSGSVVKAAECLTLDDNYSIGSVEFLMQKTGSPSGNVTATLYATTGTVGADATPTGSALATSDPIAATSLPASMDTVSFTFSTPYSASAGDIAVALEYSGGDNANAVRAAIKNPPTGYDGNYAEYTSSWTATGHSMVFSLYASAEAICPDLSTGSANNLILRIAATGGAPTVTEPAGTTAIASQASPNNLVTLAVAYEIAASYGAVGTAAFALA